MKKLMVTAALVALGGLSLQAGESLGGVDFSGRATGKFEVTDPDVSGGAQLWTRTGADDGESVVVEAGENKYLKIDESGVLARKLKADPCEIPENGGISVASKVQFTAQDAEDTAPAVADGAKIALWAQVGDNVTNLMITCGKALGDTTLTNYVTNIELSGDKDEWYDLVVKAENNGQNGTAFTITVGDTPVTAENGTITKFQSLVAFGETGYNKIASLGFKGTGAADDLVFSTYDLEQPIQVAVSITPAEAVEAIDTLSYTLEGEEAVEFGTDGFEIMLSSIQTTITINGTADGYKPYEKTYTKAQFEALGGTLPIAFESAQTPTQIFLAAIDSAEDGATVTATDDIDFSTQLSTMKTISKNLTLDFAGHDVTGLSNKTLEIIGGKTLTIIATDSTVTGVRINVGKATDNNGNLVITGGTWTMDNNTIVHVNGECSDSDVTITGATMTATGDNAIQFCGQGTFAITGSTITGATAVYCKAGTLTVGTSTLTGNGNANYQYYGNGAIATGDAVVLDNCGYPYGPANVTFDAETVLVSVNKGQFNLYGDKSAGTIKKAEALDDIVAPADYKWGDASEGYKTLVKKAFVIQIVDGEKYETIQEAFDAAKDGDTLKLLADATFAPATMYTLPATMTLDLNGKNLTGNGGKTFEVINGKTLTVNATDSTVTGVRINVGKATDNNGNLVITGGTWTIDNNTLVHVNGECSDSDVTITDATMTATGDNAIQFCGQGAFAITGSTITGATAVYCKAGTLTVGTSTLTGNGNANYQYYGNGAIATGDAVVLDNCGYPYGPASVTFNAGTVLDSANKGQFNLYGDKSAGTIKMAEALSLTAPTGYKWGEASAGYKTLTAIDYATLTIATVENLSIVVSNDTAEVASGAKFDKDDATQLTVYRTPAEGYELDGYEATEVITMSVDVEVTGAVKKASSGPVTPIGGGAVTEDPDEPGTYIAAGDPSSHQVTIMSGLKDTDTILVKDSTITAVNGVPASQIKIELNGHEIDQSVFVGDPTSANSFSLELNENGAAADGTPVKPTLTEDEPFVVGDADAAVTVKAIPGLKYALLRGDEPGAIATTVVEATVAEESEIELKDQSEKSTKAFYKVTVTK